MVVTIDCGAGNLMSISKAVQRLAGLCCVASDPVVTGSADPLILPGVGAFGPALWVMRQNGPAQSSLLRRFLEFAGEEVIGCSSFPLLTCSVGSA